MTTVLWGNATDIGRARAENEDALFAEQPVFVVADGIGGTVAGGEASRLAVEEFRRLACSPLVDAAAVRETVSQANESILQAARCHEGWSGMGTTLVGLALVQDVGESYWLVFNIGDSRAYRLVNETLEQITVDHAVGHELTRALGLPHEPAADYWLLKPTAGERFLLCSDGLTNELADEQLCEALTASAGPDVVARELVRAAVAAGGRDNVSVVVVDVVT